MRPHRAILHRDPSTMPLILRCDVAACRLRGEMCHPAGCYLGGGRDEDEIDRLARRCGYDVRLPDGQRSAA